MKIEIYKKYLKTYPLILIGLMGCFILSFILVFIVSDGVPPVEIIPKDKWYVGRMPKFIQFWGDTVFIGVIIVIFSSFLFLIKKKYEEMLIYTSWIPFFMFFSPFIKGASWYLSFFLVFQMEVAVGLSAVIVSFGAWVCNGKFENKEPFYISLFHTFVAGIPFIYAIISAAQAII